MTNNRENMATKKQPTNPDGTFGSIYTEKRVQVGTRIAVQLEAELQVLADKYFEGDRAAAIREAISDWVQKKSK